MKNILVLGCTGSIGTNTLNIARNMPDKFSICGLSAWKNKESLETLSNEFNCPCTLTSKDGIEGITDLIEKTCPDIVVNGISGAAGLLPSKIVLEHSITLALANKETVVMAWNLIKDIAHDNKAKIIPVDSEHSAIFTLLSQVGKDNTDEIIITASGGPFWKLTTTELENVTVEQTLSHPTWKMGKKITVDSASLANKGLEVIEAARLFDIPTEKIKVIIHPQSFVHSFVRTKDGMLYAQISEPDMKHPIFSALTHPEIDEMYFKPFDLFDKTMTFFRPRIKDFPMLEYAYECTKKSKSYTIAYNAANEIAVEAFLSGKISFTAIPRIVRTVLDKDWNKTPYTFEEVLEQDNRARDFALGAI